MDIDPQTRGLTQELVYGICRWYGELDFIASQLLGKPIRNKDRVVYFLLLVGLYQLRHLETAPHAAVSETVSGVHQLQKQWAKNLINGCLRSYQRDAGKFQFSASQSHRLAHPTWLTEQLSQYWPEQVEHILAANNNRPPMCLRVNQRQHKRADYLQALLKAEIEATEDPFTNHGLVLTHPVGVGLLPGFHQGSVSVQDTAAQLAAEILRPKPDQSILDACAAPGGKAAHLLEACDNKIHLDAIDVSEQRCEQLKQTFTRLKLDARIFIADSTQPNSWSAPEAGYDHILIDAPCSGTGVIRRHPDIKHHRRASDIDRLKQIQSKLLQSLWPLVKPGGQLLYMTCSVLPPENQDQISAFLAAHTDAQPLPLNLPQGIKTDSGWQTLPGCHQMDGFFYALLRKME
jgi:16S rRNA (cytosine967-C5)-methyltransferase